MVNMALHIHAYHGLMHTKLDSKAAKESIPWLTKSIIQLMRKRNTLFRAASRTKTEAAVTKYKILMCKKQSCCLLWTSKSKYFRNLGHSSQKDFWKAVKLIPESDKALATLLNKFFYSCFNDSFRPLTEPTHLDPSKCPPHLLCTKEPDPIKYRPLCCGQPLCLSHRV